MNDLDLYHKTYDNFLSSAPISLRTRIELMSKSDIGKYFTINMNRKIASIKSNVNDTMFNDSLSQYRKSGIKHHTNYKHLIQHIHNHE